MFAKVYLERRRRGDKGHRIAFQEIRPGAGLKTGDFFQEKLGGVAVERPVPALFARNNDQRSCGQQAVCCSSVDSLSTFYFLPRDLSYSFF